MKNLEEIVNLSNIKDFLGCETPSNWLRAAQIQLPVLLIDHAHCEKKAASTALGFIFRYPDRNILVHQMSRFAREELRHFEKVLYVLEKRGIVFNHLAPSKYAQQMHHCIRSQEPFQLIDRLIVAAFIEARSCERFAQVAPLLENDLERFYQGLLAAEARHFEVYLDLAHQLSPQPIDERVTFFRKLEKKFIMSPDPCFRFHSGIPIS